jgi:hypothetical protein
MGTATGGVREEAHREISCTHDEGPQLEERHVNAALGLRPACERVDISGPGRRHPRTAPRASPGPRSSPAELAARAIDRFRGDLN